MVFPTSYLRGDPFAELRRPRFSTTRHMPDSGGGFAASRFPAVNLWTGDAGVAVTAEIPGVEPGDIDITVREDVLTIAGERRPPESEALAWHRRERSFGRFSRAVRLPFRVDPDRVEARFRNGLLEILLQRPAAERPRRIEIKTS